MIPQVRIHEEGPAGAGWRDEALIRRGGARTGTAGFIAKRREECAALSSEEDYPLFIGGV
jgi:hypothetical protein